MNFVEYYGIPRLRNITFACALISGIVGVTVGDDSIADGASGETQRAPTSAPPSLDELLGLPGSDQTERDAEEAARRDAEEMLQRRLEQGRQAVNTFAEAIEKMALSADLLDGQFDSGIGTQRIQEDILAQLQNLIDSAEQVPSDSSSSDSQPQNQDSQSQPGQQQQQQQQGERSEQVADGEPQEGMPPALQQGDVHVSIEETRAEWGALPDRIREILIQGMDEKFSSLYEQLTREYYRSLASD